MKSQAERPCTAVREAALSSAAVLALASALALTWAPACGPPTVDARAVWIASQHGSGGARTLSIYDAGELDARELVPTDPGPDADSLPLVVELDPRGQGALVRATDSGWQPEPGDSFGSIRAGFVDFTGKRTIPLALPAGALPSALAFTAAGGALWWTVGCPAELQLVPLHPRVAAEVAADTGVVAPLVWPLPDGCAESWGAVSAADAPVIFAVQGVPENGSIRPGPGGHVLALSYPSGRGVGYEDAPALSLVRQASLPTTGLRRLPRVRCHTPGPSCGLAVVDPDGRGISFGGTDPAFDPSGDCRLWRWDLADEAPICVLDDHAPPWAGADNLVAAVSPTRYVFRDGLVIRRYDWLTGEHDARPLIGRISELTARMAADGRAVVFASVGGAVLRADHRDLDLLSAEQSPCPGFQPPIASPSGRFVAWTCTVSGDDGEDGLAAGEVVRVSAAGMQRFQGVPMWAVAIDDDGDLLLHSRDDQDFSLELLLPPSPPRNLYVLSAGGELARIDALEPDPELTRGLGDAVYRWIAAQAL